jgi:hypothetical protein
MKSGTHSSFFSFTRVQSLENKISLLFRFLHMLTDSFISDSMA